MQWALEKRQGNRILALMISQSKQFKDKSKPKTEGKW